MSKDKNFGIASPRVRLLSHLPRVVRKAQTYNFDVSAFQWNAISNSPFLSPLLTENVTDKDNTFAVCFPSKRKFFVNNMLVYVKPGDPPGIVSSYPVETSSSEFKTSNPPKGTILWTPVGPPQSPPSGGAPAGASTIGIINEILKEQGFPSYYEGIDVSNPVSRIPLIDESNPPVEGTYRGPKWVQRTYKEQAQPDDRKILNNFRNFITGGTIPNSGNSLLTPLKVRPEREEVDRTMVYQENVGDGLWWGIESNHFLGTNMPFWVTIEINEDPPSPSNFETLFIISLGVSSNSNNDRYDLVLRMNSKPMLIDYYGTSGDGKGDQTVKEFDSDPSRLRFGDKKIDVGFMTSGGRLIIFVNNETLVYKRIVKTGSPELSGTIKEANIRKGRIRVYGTNMIATVYAYPMTFAEQGAMAFPIASKKTLDSVSGPAIVTNIEYSSTNDENEPTGFPVSLLPKSAATVADQNKVYGVDCEDFTDRNGTLITTDSFGLHKEGSAEFYSLEDLFGATTRADSTPGFGNPGGPLPNTEIHMLFLTPSSRNWLGLIIPHSKTPYFFRLKGVDKADRDTGTQIITDATPDVISIKEDSSAPDYFHIKKSANITLYNENGKYDILKTKQFGIQIDWAWDDNERGINRIQTFTGVITSHDTSETPGKETITLQCEDYNYVLKNTPIVNSPFYDGMVGFHAVRDLAKRAGIKDFQKSWDPVETEYFLPSGYSFSSPKVRFKTTDKIFDCIITIVKRFEAYIYFDGLGRMHIDKLPGGLFGVPPELIEIPNRFSSNPLSGLNTILDQKNISIDFNSTFNQINLMTLDRDTRNPIMLGTVAGKKDRLTFKKEYMVDQSAYGDKESAKVHMNELAERIFAPIRKTSFKTVGRNSVLSPLEFILVDGVPFRLGSISRTFTADTNDYVNEYEAQWLNG